LVLQKYKINRKQKKEKGEKLKLGKVVPLPNK